MLVQVDLVKIVFIVQLNIENFELCSFCSKLCQTQLIGARPLHTLQGSCVITAKMEEMILGQPNNRHLSCDSLSSSEACSTDFNHLDPIAGWFT